MAEKEAYDSSEIRVLEGLEPVRLRPGMYIGSTGYDGLHHLIKEIADNSIDEAIAGYANKIDITTFHPRALPSGGGRRHCQLHRGLYLQHLQRLHPLSALRAAGTGDGGQKQRSDSKAAGKTGWCRSGNRGQRGHHHPAR